MSSERCIMFETFAQNLTGEELKNSFDLDLASFPGKSKPKPLRQGELILGIRKMPSHKLPLISPMQWGFIPQGAEEAKDLKPKFLAKYETADTSRWYSKAFAHRRCIVPVKFLYFSATNHAELSGKRWWRLHRGRGQPMGMAGIWEIAGSTEGAPITVTILTTKPNKVVREICSRMPLILDDQSVLPWLNPHLGNVDTIKTKVKPCISGMDISPVNNPL